MHELTPAWRREEYGTREHRIVLPVLLLTLGIYVLSIPLADHYSLGSVGTISKYLGVLFAFTYLCLKPVQLRALPWSGWIWILWIFATALWSAEPLYTTERALLLAAQIGMLILIASYVANHPFVVMRIFSIYTFGALAVAAAAAFNFFSSGGSRVAAFQGQDQDQFATLLMPAVIYCFDCVIRRQTKSRLPYIFALLLLLAAVVFSGTRGVWLSLVIAILFCYRIFTRPRILLSVALVVCLIALIATRIPLISEFIAGRLQTALSGGGSGRLEIWRVGGYMLMQHPVYGIGYGIFPIEYVKQVTSYFPDVALWHGTGPHSIYLGAAVELGIPGLLLLVAWLLPLVLKRIPVPPVLETEWRVAKATLVAMLCEGAFLDIFNRKYFWLSVAVMTGLWLAVAAIRRGHAQYLGQGET